MYAAYGIASCQSSGASLVVRIFTTLYITLTIRDVLSEFDKPPMGAACTATSSVSRLAFAARVVLLFKQPLGKEPFRRWEPFGIHNSSGFPNRIPAISLKNVQVGAVLSSTVYLQPL